MDQSVPISSATLEAGSTRQAPISLQTRMVVLSYLAYFFYYFTRKHLGVATAALVREGYREDLIATAQTGYAVCYIIGQMLSGALGDRLGPRIALCSGMVLSAISSMAFGIFPFMGVLVIGTTLNGLFQGSGWSNSCKVISSWVGHAKRGRVMGVWMTCYILGSLAANATAGFLLKEYGWKHMFLFTGLTVLAIGTLQGLFLINRPEDKGFTVEREETEETSAGKPEGFMTMLRQPAVILLGLSYTGMKFVRYTFFVWLPYYLSSVIHLDDAKSAYVSNGFEVGGVIGLLIGGWFADRYFEKNRARLALVALIGMAIALGVYRGVSAQGHIGANVLSLASIGFFLYIADSIVSGTAAQDIGGAGSTASAAGIINGIGSTGQLFAGFLPIWLKNHYGWDSVFVAFIVLAILSCVAILPVARKRELKRV